MDPKSQEQALCVSQPIFRQELKVEKTNKPAQPLASMSCLTADLTGDADVSCSLTYVSVYEIKPEDTLEILLYQMDAISAASIPSVYDLVLNGMIYDCKTDSTGGIAFKFSAGGLVSCFNVKQTMFSNIGNDILCQIENKFFRLAARIL